jgi:hypothetical protein
MTPRARSTRAGSVTWVRRRKTALRRVMRQLLTFIGRGASMMAPAAEGPWYRSDRVAPRSASGLVRTPRPAAAQGSLPPHSPLPWIALPSVCGSRGRDRGCNARPSRPLAVLSSPSQPRRIPPASLRPRRLSGTRPPCTPGRIRSATPAATSAARARDLHHAQPPMPAVGRTGCAGEHGFAPLPGPQNAKSARLLSARSGRPSAASRSAMTGHGVIVDPYGLGQLFSSLSSPSHHSRS